MKHKLRSLAYAPLIAFGAVIAFSDVAPAQAPTPPRQVIREDLNGLDGQEVIMQELMLAPGGATPWHTHPDGHEIGYVLSGTLKTEVEGKGATEYKPGEGFHINPGVVHRGLNEGSEPARLLVVRVNTKGRPLMVPVQK